LHQRNAHGGHLIFIAMENLESLKDGIASGRLNGVKELKVTGEISEFPEEILELAESLELLVLSGNKLTSLPPSFAKLQQLKIVFCNNNRFDAFPSVLAECPHLSMISFKSNQIKTVPEGVLSPVVRWLILTDNKITALPSDIGRLNKLQKLMLAGNELRSLPAEMANCTNLELIRLSANQLDKLPQWLFNLPRLSWLAYAGNPFCKQKEDKKAAALPDIDENELVLGQVLGQGASGVIYQSSWQGRTVAVKLFKGDVTSDGRPLDEMRACIAAGNHPNLVNVLGKLKAATDKTGLVFSFIAPEYQNLGGPPSLDSCTRDVYDDEVSFSLAAVLKIAKGIAAAIAHLHTRSITHGDLYAHNILINESGESILGDFGAASFFDTDNTTERKSLQRLESRAYGCLLEDLLNRSVINQDIEKEVSLFDKLKDIQIKCMSQQPAERPLFKEICENLP